MLTVTDPYIRFLLLNYLVVRLGHSDVERGNAEPADIHRVAGLRELSVLDLMSLARTRSVKVEISVDAGSLDEALRGVARVRDRRDMEAYFLRHGASSRLMTTLFKVERRDTFRRRRMAGAWRPRGRHRLPDVHTRDRVHRLWLSLEAVEPTERFWRLHQSFPSLPLAALEAILKSYGAWP